MKHFAVIAIVLGVLATGNAAPVMAAPCPAIPGANFCTPRNTDNPMAPYEGKKEPRSAKDSPRSAGRPGS